MLQLQLCLPLLPFSEVLQLLYLSYKDAVKDVKHVKASFLETGSHGICHLLIPWGLESFGHQLQLQVLKLSFVLAKLTVQFLFESYMCDTLWFLKFILCCHQKQSQWTSKWEDFLFCNKCRNMSPVQRTHMMWHMQPTLTCGIQTFIWVAKHLKLEIEPKTSQGLQSV